MSYIQISKLSKGKRKSLKQALDYRLNDGQDDQTISDALHLSPEYVARRRQRAIDWEAGREGRKQAYRDSQNEMIRLAPATWESEKAIGIDVIVSCFHTDQAARTRVFFPKSKIIDGAAPRWLVGKKIEEAMEVAGNYPKSALDVEGLLA